MRFEKNYGRIAAGLTAGLILPVALGLRHAAPALFLLYALLAGSLLSVGDWLSGGLQFGDWTCWILESGIKALAVFLVGGFAFLGAYLLS